MGVKAFHYFFVNGIEAELVALIIGNETVVTNVIGSGVMGVPGRIGIGCGDDVEVALMAGIGSVGIDVVGRDRLFSHGHGAGSGRVVGSIRFGNVVLDVEAFTVLCLVELPNVFGIVESQFGGNAVCCILASDAHFFCVGIVTAVHTLAHDDVILSVFKRNNAGFESLFGVIKFLVDGSATFISGVGSS